jgi:hypothetical protein
MPKTVFAKNRDPFYRSASKKKKKKKERKNPEKKKKKWAVPRKPREGGQNASERAQSAK